jgi:hypothetical protein
VQAIALGEEGLLNRNQRRDSKEEFMKTTIWRLLHDFDKKPVGQSRRTEIVRAAIPLLFPHGQDQLRNGKFSAASKRPESRRGNSEFLGHWQTIVR